MTKSSALARAKTRRERIVDLLKDWGSSRVKSLGVVFFRSSGDGGRQGTGDLRSQLRVEGSCAPDAPAAPRWPLVGPPEPRGEEPDSGTPPSACARLGPTRGRPRALGRRPGHRQATPAAP